MLSPLHLLRGSIPNAWVSGAKHSSTVIFSYSPGLSRECCRPYTLLRGSIPNAWVSGAKHSSTVIFSYSPGLSRECCRPYTYCEGLSPMPGFLGRSIPVQ
ncbi:MAG: hypothetical protein F6J93_25985 [Oscillatoria sp. SIO1A7]|nr:hypothetical protein [Oscillatoria sp. SIO1A7]